MELTVQEALQRGIQAHKAGNLSEAETLYSAILRFDSDEPDANHNLGVLFKNTGRCDQALSLFQTALKANPDMEQYWLSFFGGLVSEKKFQEARRLINASREKAVADERVQQMEKQLANELDALNPPTPKLEPLVNAYNRSDHDQMLLLSDDLLSDYPRSSLVLNYKGAAFAGLGDWHEAQKYFEFALRDNPHYIDAVNNLGGALKMQGKWESALDYFNKAIRLDPDYPQSYFNAGNLYKDSEKCDLAVPLFEKAIELDNEYYLAYIDLGTCLCYLEEYERARFCLEKGLAEIPNSYDGHYSLASLEHNRGALADAENHLAKAVSINPQKKHAQLALNYVFHEKQRREAASPNLLAASPGGIFFASRPATATLKDALCAVETRSFDDPSVVDTRYGPGFSNKDFQLMEHPNIEIQTMFSDLTEIMQRAVGREIDLYASFLNVAKAGSGSKPHAHNTIHDQHFGLRDVCYSLIYYLDVGDQNCEEPGILKVLDPDLDYLPKNGDIVIMHGLRRHYATYGGTTDRILVGINFYATGADFLAE